MARPDSTQIDVGEGGCPGRERHRPPGSVGPDLVALPGLEVPDEGHPPGLGVNPPSAVEGIEPLTPPPHGVGLPGKRPLVLPARLRVAVGARQDSPRRLIPSGIVVPDLGCGETMPFLSETRHGSRLR